MKFSRNLSLFQARFSVKSHWVAGQFDFCLVMIQKIQIDPLPYLNESLADLQRLFLRGPLHNQRKRQVAGLGLHSKEQNGVILGIGDHGWKLLGIGGHQIEYSRMLFAGHLFAEMNNLIETVALSWICIGRGGDQQQEVRGKRSAKMIAIVRL